MNDENLFDTELFTQWADALAPVQPPVAVRERLMARVRAEHPLTRLRTIRSAEGWMDFGPGIRFKILHRDETGRANSLLARLDAGVTLLPHLHAANEECLVLEGEITYDDITVWAGDYHFAPKGAAHPALTTRAGALIFLRSGMGEPVPEFSAAR